MKITRWVWLFIMLLVWAGCSAEEPAASIPPSMDGEDLATKAEVVQGDFMYRLVTEKGVYREGEDIAVYAELEYVGDEEQVVIFHGASPFYFNLYEKTRNYEIPYAMNQPLLSTVIARGEPLRETYAGSGAFGSNDPPAYIAFMKRIMEGDFPAGDYVVNGIADFYVETEDGERTLYRIEGQIGFQVK